MKNIEALIEDDGDITIGAMGSIECAPTSGVPGFFINPFDMGEFPDLLSQFVNNGKTIWVDLTTSLANAPFVTIASIQDRSRQHPTSG